jgi:hypothetical protein
MTSIIFGRSASATLDDAPCHPHRPRRDIFAYPPPSCGSKTTEELNWSVTTLVLRFIRVPSPQIEQEGQ